MGRPCTSVLNQKDELVKLVNDADATIHTIDDINITGQRVDRYA